MYKYVISFSKYKLRDYEKNLALNEFETLFPGLKQKKINIDDIEVETEDKLDENRLKKLTFFSEFSFENSKKSKKNVVTEQAILEGLNSIQIDLFTAEYIYSFKPNASREIRYLSHALHEYKGRFYPQLAKSFMNYAGIKKGQTVLDPFCGSGTTLLESLLYGINAFGIDINPIAYMLAKAKVRSLHIPINQIEKVKKHFASIDTNGDWEKIDIKSMNHLDIEYLTNWFPETNLKKVFFLINEFQKFENKDNQLLLKVVLSNILRKFSLQDPRQLRIGRRKDTPTTKLLQKFKKDLFEHLHTLEKFQKLKYFKVDSLVENFLGDVRNITSTTSIEPNSIDLVITSPPYATALPYVDTDRLSLFVFGFTDKKTFRELERSLIGNREISKYNREILDKELEGNFKRSVLPDTVMRLLEKIYKLNKSANVGFRRKNTSALLFKYFIDMHKGIEQISRVLKKNKYAFFVVGNNRTEAGGENIVIPTDDFIAMIAESNNFELVEKIAMTVQPSYFIHAKNAINTESILVLKRK